MSVSAEGGKELSKCDGEGHKPDPTRAARAPICTTLEGKPQTSVTTAVTTASAATGVAAAIADQRLLRDTREH
eukprot:SAG11_NODE_908_length_6589_cov_5.484129_2_plen_73_part_00